MRLGALDLRIDGLSGRVDGLDKDVERIDGEMAEKAGLAGFINLDGLGSYDGVPGAITFDGTYEI